MPRILLIDDDKRLHELLTGYLDQNGFTSREPPTVTGARERWRPRRSTSFCST